MTLIRKKFSLLITTKDRLNELITTLEKIYFLLQRPDVSCIVCDDGSTDGTTEYLKINYPNIHLIRNQKSKGLIYSRNKLLNLTNSEFSISIDDDLHFITENPLELIEDYFGQHPECGLIGFRIFWSTSLPISTDTEEKPLRMKSFAGGAHVWRMKAWKQIPDYPSWFIFHGEEDFAAYEMFKKGLQVHHLPSILVHHRVDIKARKKNADYTIRLRRSLRSGWYLYFLFFPLRLVPGKLLYSIYIQFKTKVFKGDIKVLNALIFAFFDLIISFPKILKHRNRLTLLEYAEFQKLEDTKIYWKPKKSSKGPAFTILISTKNRKDDLSRTLDMINTDLVECVVFDDGSIDGTYEFVQRQYPNIIIYRNEVSKGYLFCRNKMLNETNAEFAISLDDDAHFLTLDPFKKIEEHFLNNPKCGLIGFRLFWSTSDPSSIETTDCSKRVKGFVGCGHVWRMKAWKEIPDYPEWFVFYGEEDFAAYEMFKKDLEIHYLPDVLVNHRVDFKVRRMNADYSMRLRRSLRSGWCLYFLFFPLKAIPRKMFYSIWIQLKTKVFKGDFKAMQALLLAFFDLIFSFPKIAKHSNRLTADEYSEFQKLEDTKLYWKPEK